MNIMYMRGVESNSLYINDTRVSGPKPWGGGKIIKEWNITNIDDLKKIQQEIEQELREMVGGENMESQTGLKHLATRPNFGRKER